MSLTVCGRIVETHEVNGTRIGRVLFGGVLRETSLDLVPDVECGDYVLVYLGSAVGELMRGKPRRCSAKWTYLTLSRTRGNNARTGQTCYVTSSFQVTEW